MSDGNVANYTPQLARMSPNYWGVSICTVDGQRISFGDSKVPFCVQSVSKALNYSIAASEMGAEYVHKYVGQEPSGRLFNEICLDQNNKPHNPMVNSGAIIVSSLIRAHLNMADRFEYMINEYKKMAGGEYVGFNNAVFLSEAATADRNFALAYFMKENGCFPEESKQTSLKETLDFYFQLCSLEVNCEGAAVIASTLANGGVCPLTGERCIGSRPCRDVLSLMNSCGMYDYSGQFAFHVGLPAKSGVSGVTIVVVPNLMGIALWSPPLDRMGNSCRSVHFCKKLIDRFNFHNYDSLAHNESRKFDPRRRVGEREKTAVVSLLFAAKAGDLNTIRRMYLQGCELEMADYDKRTALHLAASEGHFDVALFLLETGKVQPDPRDRWNRTPLDDARSAHHTSVALLLERRMQDICQQCDLPANKVLKSRAASLQGLHQQAANKSGASTIEMASPPAFNRQMSGSPQMTPTMAPLHIQPASPAKRAAADGPPMPQSPLCRCSFSVKQLSFHRSDSATMFSCSTIDQSSSYRKLHNNFGGGGSLRNLCCAAETVADVGQHYDEHVQQQQQQQQQHRQDNDDNTEQYNHHHNSNNCNIAQPSNNQLLTAQQQHQQVQQNQSGGDDQQHGREEVQPNVHQLGDQTGKRCHETVDDQQNDRKSDHSMQRHGESSATSIFDYYHDVQHENAADGEDADSLDDFQDRGISLRYTEISDNESLPHGGARPAGEGPIWMAAPVQSPDHQQQQQNDDQKQQQELHHGRRAIVFHLQQNNTVEEGAGSSSEESDEEEEEDILTESNDVQKISQMRCPPQPSSSAAGSSSKLVA